jgi:hypothetical protein
MRKFLIAAATLLAVAAPVAVVAAPADAAVRSPKCMTKTEWRTLSEGMTRAQVHTATGIWGKQTYRTDYSDGEIDLDYDYRQCNRYGKPVPGSWNTVSINFDNVDYTEDYDMFFTSQQVNYVGAWSAPWTV